MGYRAGCPHCGLNDKGNDDIILEQRVIDISGADLTLFERRVCDICAKVYTLHRMYEHKYDVLK